MKTLFLLLLSSVYGLQVDIVSNFCLDQLSPGYQIAIETGLNVRSVWPGFETYLNTMYREDVDKVIVMGENPDPLLLVQIPEEKLIHFIWEAQINISPAYLNHFSRIYTFNDDQIDNVHFFKFLYPVLLPMISPTSYSEKKLCTMISYRPTPERVKIAQFFESKPLEDFEFYGYYPTIESSRYRGAIPGHPSGDEKISILKQYRFAVCFENSFVNGYITEKIFTAFAAGCIPIYLGAPNVEMYIPKECFIDYRDFQSDEELYQMIKNMSEETYQCYIERIREYLNSEKAYQFSPEFFNEIIFNAASS